ncbi:hypothetical protein RVN83_01060 [Streptomyces sp. PU10]|uniref:hypothetical protein n=1 Tax=Streptomyces sp. PU10 TaxID=3062780 RepID=UPI0028FC49AD|nr:hypothetical protein [Streptomyces sp. PU10]MDU0251909.1 hypothetical protein [Streptomyces sp. PU10]
MTGQPVGGEAVGGEAVKAFPAVRSEARLLVPALTFIALTAAAVASLGTPLITSVATSFHVSLDSAQWTLTVALLSGAVATPVLGRRPARAGEPRSSSRWRSSSPAARSPCCRCRSRGCWPAGRPRASGSG